MLKKGPAMVLIKGEMVHLLKVYIFIVFQYANSMNMEAFPTHAALIWKWQKWTTFLGMKTWLNSQISAIFVPVCVKKKNVSKTYIYNSVFLSSSRNGWKGLHSTYWIERGFDGFSGCELDFNTDLKTQRQKSKHVYDDKPK